MEMIMTWPQISAQLADLHHFLNQGGYVLWAILCMNIVLWSFISERIWYFWWLHPKQVKAAKQRWQHRTDKHSWHAQQIRTMIVAQVQARLTAHLTAIHIFVELLPVLGLLGTVVGMIHAFEVLNLFGTGNARALGSSISQAMVTTLAGLIGAIPALFFSSILQKRAEHEKDRLADQLEIT